MKFFPNATRTAARLALFTALLLAVASLCLTQLYPVIQHDSALAQGSVAVVNAASYANDANKALTPDTISAAFGTFVTQNNQNFLATAQPLPTTLGGVRITINNVAAGIFFVSPGQINFNIPANIADGDATIVVTNSDNTTRTGTFKVERASPGIFSARSNGQGAAAAVTTVDGVNYASVANPDLSEKDVSAGTKANPNYLVLYTTGLRYTPAQNPTDGNGVAEAVTVKLQGVTAAVQYAGPAPNFTGLDQINLIIPPEMAGLGIVNITVTANNRTSNAVTIKLAGEFPLIRASPIDIGQTVGGTLAIDDPVQAGTGGKTFFFDAYKFTTTAPNTTVAVDYRSTAVNPLGLLYKINGTRIDQVSFDNNTGGIGTGRIENNNALILAVLPEAGEYVVFATTADDNPNGVGAYTIRVTTNIAQQINYGQTLSNASITNTDLQTSAGTYLDVYWFTGVANDNVQIAMNSTSFNSLLLVQSNDNEAGALDDDSGGNGNARITYRLEVNGIHVIICTPYEANRTGSYSLSLTKLSSFGAEAAQSYFKVPGREVSDLIDRSLKSDGTVTGREYKRRSIE